MFRAFSSFSPATLHQSGHRPAVHKPSARHTLNHHLPKREPSPGASPRSLDPASFPTNSAITADRLVIIQRGSQARGPRNVTLAEALEAAQEAEDDLVQLPCNTDPPVALLVHHSSLQERPAYVYEKFKSVFATRRTDKVKEITLSTKSQLNDVDRKIQDVRRLLEEGYKVSVTVECAMEQDGPSKRASKAEAAERERQAAGALRGLAASDKRAEVKRRADEEAAEEAGRKKARVEKAEAEGRKRIAAVLERLRESGAGAAAPQSTGSGEGSVRKERECVFSVVVSPLDGRWGPLSSYVEAADRVLRQVAGLPAEDEPPGRAAKGGGSGARSQDSSRAGGREGTHGRERKKSVGR